ncbi:hypothetical protein [Phenylobacterium sp.]|jgi:hypothetical protein|uniref:hypothetical protein n=1 Tax=Phenylobacterium sp. TaxID=1871053 RepID=UPI002E3102C6|nr:hypothetical protein [Phenylobacterium sp.]HEX4710307.1 hypothetical protein [Phenylobacterium sp.]
MKGSRKSLAAVLVAALVAGCTTTGTGEGGSRTGAVTAQFSWKQSGAQSGQMTAMLNTGATYAGQFFQITSETRVDDLDPLWVGWGRRWRGWDDWGPDTTFVTNYSGRVAANLQGPGGYMRCQFQLARPSSGMAGGGAGRCQLPDGTTINATFPPG